MEFIRKYWLIVIILSILSGVAIKLGFASFDLTPKIITEFTNGETEQNTYYVRELKYPIAEVISDLLISFSLALLIALVFIRAFETADKEKFETKLLQFQKATAKDAISSSFERLIDKDFFEIIKSDVLNAKFQRKDLRWQYDIERDEQTNTMTLTRTISYLLENISNTEQAEGIYYSSFSTAHCLTEMVTVKCKMDGEKEFTDLILQDQDDQGILKHSTREIRLAGGKSGEVVAICKQTFPRDYIFETHFINKGGTGLELTVNIPIGYEFSINPTVLAGRTETLINENTKKVFRIKGAIYRGQGIEFMCFKSKLDVEKAT